MCKSKIINHLNDIKFFASNQFGFLKQKLTDLAIFHKITDLVDCIEVNAAAMTLYLDLAKAFDTVNHDRLIAKLKSMGFEGSLLSWFESYLDKKPHTVKLNGKESITA